MSLTVLTPAGVVAVAIRKKPVHEACGRRAPLRPGPSEALCEPAGEGEVLLQCIKPQAQHTRPPPQTQPEQAPNQQAEAQQQQQQQQRAQEQAQLRAHEESRRDAQNHVQQLHAQQRAREAEQQRADTYNNTRAMWRDLLREELPGAVAAFIGPQHNPQQPQFFYPHMGFHAPPMGRVFETWPPAVNPYA